MIKESPQERRREIQRRSYARHAETRRAGARAYRAANPDKIRAANAKRDRKKQVALAMEWSRKNPEKKRAQRRRHYAKNRERVRAAQKLYYSNPEVRERQRERMRAYYQRTRERWLEYQRQHRTERSANQREWRKKNLHGERLDRYRVVLREAVKRWRHRNRETQRGFERKRRNRKLGAAGSFTAAEFRSLCERFGNRCLCCGGQPKRLTADHVKALSRGGSDFITNIQPLCHSCNSKKGTKEIDYRGRS